MLRDSPPAQASSSGSIASGSEEQLRSMFPSVHASVLSAVLMQEKGRLPAAVEVLLCSSGHDETQSQIMQDERLARQLQAQLRTGLASTSGLDPGLLREESGEDAWESLKTMVTDAAQSVSGGLTSLTSNLSSLSSWLMADGEEEEDACSQASGAVDECGCPFMLPPPLQGVVAESKKDK